MRFPSVAVMLGLTVAGALVVSCGDLFHGTDWETLCGRDPSARGCPETTTSSSDASSTGTGGTGGTGIGGSGGTQAGGSGTGGDPCSTYCSTVVNDCVGATAQYVSSDSCEHICEILPHEDVPKANDIPCRETYAAKVAKDTSFCPAAGPGGGGKCGPVCDAYCAIMSKHCSQFVGTSAVCGDTCKTYDANVPYNTTVQAGNNLSCRLYWAIQSIEDNTMCKNASDDSAVCVDSETM